MAGGQQLFDIQDPAVASANPQKPTPTKPPVTVSDWNDPKWGEQPISGYSLTGPFEDFAESFMAYVYASAVLKARSPARWSFIDGQGEMEARAATAHSLTGVRLRGRTRVHRNGRQTPPRVGSARVAFRSRRAA